MHKKNMSLYNIIKIVVFLFINISYTSSTSSSIVEVERRESPIFDSLASRRARPKLTINSPDQSFNADVLRSYTPPQDPRNRQVDDSFQHSLRIMPMKEFKESEFADMPDITPFECSFSQTYLFDPINVCMDLVCGVPDGMVVLAAKNRRYKKLAALFKRGAKPHVIDPDSQLGLAHCAIVYYLRRKNWVIENRTTMYATPVDYYKAMYRIKYRLQQTLAILERNGASTYTCSCGQELEHEGELQRHILQEHKDNRSKISALHEYAVKHNYELSPHLTQLLFEAAQ